VALLNLEAENIRAQPNEVAVVQQLGRGEPVAVEQRAEPRTVVGQEEAPVGLARDHGMLAFQVAAGIAQQRQG
jgi:hypothetical protein